MSNRIHELREVIVTKRSELLVNRVHLVLKCSQWGVINFLGKSVKLPTALILCVGLLVCAHTLQTTNDADSNSAGILLPQLAWSARGRIFRTPLVLLTMQPKGEWKEASKCTPNK